MKHYNEYTEEEIEDLARECEQLAEKNSELAQRNAELWETIECLAQALNRLVAYEGLNEEVLRNLRRSGAIPQKEPLDSDLPF